LAGFACSAVEPACCACAATCHATTARACHATAAALRLLHLPSPSAYTSHYLTTLYLPTTYSTPYCAYYLLRIPTWRTCIIPIQHCGMVLPFIRLSSSSSSVMPGSLCCGSCLVWMARRRRNGDVRRMLTASTPDGRCGIAALPVILYHSTVFFCIRGRFPQRFYCGTAGLPLLLPCLPRRQTPPSPGDWCSHLPTSAGPDSACVLFLPCGVAVSPSAGHASQVWAFCGYLGGHWLLCAWECPALFLLFFPVRTYLTGCYAAELLLQWVYGVPLPAAA